MLIWGLVLLLAGSASLGAFVYYSAQKLDAHHRELAQLEALAQTSSVAARERVERGDYDLLVTIGRPLVSSILRELEGFESISKKGNLFHINKIESHFENGFIRLDAEADLDSKLYSGPVEATYYAFTRFLSDGRCQLHFRPARAYPTGASLLKGPWLEAWIIAKLESKLPLPEITLPLGFAREVDLPEVNKLVKTKDIHIRIPARKVSLKIEKPTVLVTPEFLGFVAGRIAVGEEPKDQPQQIRTANTAPVYDSGVTMALRFHVLSDLLSQLMEPHEDVFLNAEYIKDAYKKQKRVLGIKFKNQVDLKNLNGFLDIRNGTLHLDEDLLSMDIGIGGHITGHATGKAYGIKLHHDFEVDPSLQERVPVRIRQRENDLEIVFVDNLQQIASGHNPLADHLDALRSISGHC